MIYTIRHSTRFAYSEPVRENVTEVRLNPVSLGIQRCFSFRLSVWPPVPVSSYSDQYQNRIHHFNIPYDHRAQVITAESIVGIRQSQKPLDQQVLDLTWSDLDAQVSDSELLEWVIPSDFTESTPLLEQLKTELAISREMKPFELAMETSYRLFKALKYLPNSTRFDSPIDEAISQRAGVCQDYSHIMLALLRSVGFPCRYVSGYLYHAITSNHQSPDTASHAWVEAWFPGLGWLGLDPTNNKLAGDHHIVIAYGRDYADVPPTRGVFKGSARTEMAISVRIVPEETIIESDVFRVIHDDKDVDVKPAPPSYAGSQQQ